MYRVDQKEAGIKEVKTISYQLEWSTQGMKVGETEGGVIQTRKEAVLRDI